MAYDGYDDGRRDFHFLYGRWAVEHRRLKTRGVGADDWDAFAGTSFTQGLMGGLCNVEENDFPDRGFQGVAMRTFDPEARRWAIYWVSSLDGRLQPPVFGRFEDGIGLFHGDDVDGDRPVKVVYRWDRITSASAHWSQAFSYDGGETWETNWTMAFTRSA
ncbi:DUF1579 domain-containing protein [Phenylobacterium sp.]|uniref:DUF1579 domain-containing protein n=1 Tax=Phenylobacterium sp. TaxID=1871053 RepID=UPI0025CEAC8E|nr:DUF1579 domain-containing protein [Phenylobacterium sp.]